MTDLAVLGMRFETQGANQADAEMQGLARSADQVERATNRAERATDSLGHTARYASSASGILTKSMMDQQRVLLSARSAMGLTASEGLNMSRQFTDIGVTAAMGMNPLMIAIQQGPQLMDVFQQAAIRTGRTIKAVALEAGAAIWTAMAPILPFVAAIAAAVGTVAGAWTLATRSMRKDVDDLTAGMGLTEKQMKRLEEAGVSTSVTAGDAFRGLGTTIKEVLVENFGTQIDWMAGAWSKTMDFLTEVGSIAVAGIGAAFVGTYRAIINTWQRAPAALGDIAIRTVNAMASGLDWIVQKSVDGINALVVAAKALSIVNPAFAWARGLGPVSAPRIGGMDNPYQGSAAALDRTNAAGYADAYRDVRGALAGGMERWRENTAASGRARVLDAAGDAERTRAAAAGRSGRSGASPTADAVKEIDNQPLRDQLTLLRLQATLFAASEAARAEAMAMEAKRLELEAQGFTDQNEGYAEAVRLAGGLARMQVENGQALEAYNLGLEYHLDLLRQVDDHARAAGQGLSEAFGAPGRALGDLLSGLTSVQVRLAEIDKAERQYRQSVMKTGVDQRQLAMFARDRAQAEVQSYGDMVSAAKGFFKEGSDGYQALQVAEQAYRAIQFAMSIQAMAMGGQETAFTVGQNAIRAVSHGVVAVARALASLPFPFNLAAGAATIAALAAIGVRLSGGGSGGSGGKGSGSSVAGSVETVQSQVSQQKSSGQNFVRALAQEVNVRVEFDDPMFRARIQKETVPIVQAGSQASVAASRQIIPAEQGRKARMAVGGR